MNLSYNGFYFDLVRVVCFMTCSLKLIVMAAIVLIEFYIKTQGNCSPDQKIFHEKAVDWESSNGNCEVLKIDESLSESWVTD